MENKKWRFRWDILGHYINDGVVNFLIPELNNWYRYNGLNKPWKEAAFSLIEENYSDYCDIVNYWLCSISDGDEEVKNFDWKKLGGRQ